MNISRGDAMPLANTVNAASFWVLISALIWLPIFKAGMMPGAMSALVSFMLLSLLLSAFFLLKDMPLGSSNRHRPWLLVWLVFTAAVFAHLFVMPTLFGFERLFSFSNQFDIVPSVKTAAVDSLASLRVWVFFTAIWIAAWRVSWLSFQQIHILLLVVMVASFFQATYGIVHFLGDDVSVMGLWDKEFYLHDATGTFVNRNHFSGMLAICWPLVLAGLIGKKPLLFPDTASVVRVSIAVFYSLVVIVALVSSHSRMGTAAAFLGLAIWAIGFYQSRIDESAIISKRGLLMLIFSLLVFFAIWFGVEDILQRYTQLEDGDSRTSIWAAMFDLPLLAWLIGVGPGGFEDVFHLVQPDYLKVRFIYAHNDYLEFILEFGLIFSILIALTFLYWLRSVFPKGNNGVRIGAFGSVAAVALHSITDFNLQIPASALYFWLAVGLIMNPNMVCQEEAIKGRELNKSKRRARPKLKRRKTKQEWLAMFRSD